MRHSSDNLWLHRYAVLTAAATFVLIIAGALVTSNDAGLAVPDWPLSYGRLMPPMVGGIFYEHGHRMVATTVGLLTIGLAVWLWRREPRRWVRRLGWASLGLVIAQGILGGITVLWFLPPAVSIAHACLAQLFFCCTVSLAVFTSPEWDRHSCLSSGAGILACPPAGAEVFHLALATTVAVYCQLILGAAVRHSVLGILPHVLGAVVVIALGFFAAARVLRAHGETPALRRPGVLVGALLVAQIFLGLGAYVLKYLRQDVQPLPLPVAVATAHVACGALVLAVSLMLTLRTHRLGHATAGNAVGALLAAPPGAVVRKAV